MNAEVYALDGPFALFFPLPFACNFLSGAEAPTCLTAAQANVAPSFPLPMPRAEMPFSFPLSFDVSFGVGIIAVVEAAFDVPPSPLPPFFLKRTLLSGAPSLFFS